MSSSLRALAAADFERLRDQYPDAFRTPLARRLASIGILTGALSVAIAAIWRLDVSPSRILAGLGELGSFAALMVPPHPGSWSRTLSILQSLAETVAIAFLGTILAAIVAFPLGFLAARNTTVNRLVQFMSRRLLDGVRGIDALIWALLWINVVGLGPFAGMLAIMTNDIGSFGKLFSEAIEAADRKAVEGVTASGGGRLQRIRFGILPQVQPVMLGQVLYFFESNTRSSTIIGIVGAGGIGLQLSEMIRTLEWQTVSFIIVLILATVAIIDFVSGRLRLAIIGRPVVARG